MTEIFAKNKADIVNMINKYLNMIKFSLTGALDTDLPNNWQFSMLAENNTFWRAMTCNTVRTMLGNKKLDNIRFCVEEVIKNNVVGDFIEAGCWRGGGVIYMKACLDVYEKLYDEIPNRNIYAADLFPDNKYIVLKPWTKFILKMCAHLHQLLPMAIKQKVAHQLLLAFPQETYDRSTINKIMYLGRKLPWFKSIQLPSTSSKDVKEALQRYQLWDKRIILKAGWFDKTFPSLSIDKLAILRVDADFYTSTKLTLECFYDKLEVGGYCIIDDYNGFSDCKKAVDEFRTLRKIDASIIDIDAIGIYWKKM